MSVRSMLGSLSGCAVHVRGYSGCAVHVRGAFFVCGPC
jgi:hypothetical protein